MGRVLVVSNLVGSRLRSFSSAPTKCYRQAMVGRETLCTGLGGAVGPEQVTFFKDRLKRYGQPAAPFVPFARRQEVRVLVPLRVSVARRLSNLDVLMHVIQNRDVDEKVSFQTVDFAAETPQTQVWLAQNADILFGVHGMALSYVIFLPTYGELVEVLVPESAFCPTTVEANANPWTLYGGLSRLAKIAHRCCYGGEISAGPDNESVYYNSPHEWAMRSEIDCATPEVVGTLVRAIGDVHERKYR